MGTGSVTKFLRKNNVEAVAASVDPVGSVWDRTCELYAQLTGSRTDYGKAHSERCGHKRYGKDYSKKPLLKNIKWSSENKIVTITNTGTQNATYSLLPIISRISPNALLN